MENIKLKNVRLSFPSLFKKAVFNGQETKYEATFLISKDSDQATMLEKAIAAFVEETFKGKPPRGLKITCLSDGDEKEYDGYEGMLAFKAASTKRPLVLDSDKTPLTEEDNRIYAGCYVNAIVSLWYSDHPLGGKQILGNLGGVQFYKDGESFSSGGASADDFDDFEDDDEEF
jgi:hypothetical protein